MIRKTKQLSIEVTAREVRFLLWEKNFWRNPAKVSYLSIPFKQKAEETDNRFDFKEFVEIIREYRVDYLGGKKVPVYLLIPFHNGLIREFKLPWMRRSDRDSAVKYYLQYEIPGLADELVYYYQIIEEKQSEYLTIRVNAVRKDFINAYADCIKQAGYNLKGIEYSVTAFGEILESQAEKRILSLHELKENTVQFVLYKDAVPELIREFNVSQDDINKYQIYLGLDEQIPIDGIITDSSVQAERIAKVLIDDGLALEKVEISHTQLSKMISSESKSIGAAALIGKIQKLGKKNNRDFYHSFLRLIKVKMAFFGLSLVLVSIMIMGSLVWYPLFTDYIDSQKEIESLEERYRYLQDEQKEDVLTNWKEAQEQSQVDLGKIQKGITNLRDDVSLTRLDYKQGTLYLWAECHEESSITKLIGNLVSDGWKVPLLVDYKYKKDKINFCLSVKR